MQEEEEEATGGGGGRRGAEEELCGQSPGCGCLHPQHDPHRPAPHAGHPPGNMTPTDLLHMLDTPPVTYKHKHPGTCHTHTRAYIYIQSIYIFLFVSETHSCKYTSTHTHSNMPHTHTHTVFLPLSDTLSFALFLSQNHSRTHTHTSCVTMTVSLCVLVGWADLELARSNPVQDDKMTPTKQLPRPHCLLLLALLDIGFVGYWICCNQVFTQSLSSFILSLFVLDIPSLPPLPSLPLSS